MMNNINTIEASGLQFFGKISASISHEVRNTLAVINESAGLLEDFAFMAEKGLPIDPERIKMLSGQILKQVQRAEYIIGNMNRFAHSMDEPVKKMDIKDILSFITALTAKLASNHGITVDVEPHQPSAMITTNPFLLLTLVFLLLDFIYTAPGNGKTVHLTSKTIKNGAEIRIARPDSRINADTFPAEREKALANMLNAELAFDEKTEEIVIRLPESGSITE